MPKVIIAVLKNGKKEAKEGITVLQCEKALTC